MKKKTIVFRFFLFFVFFILLFLVVSEVLKDKRIRVRNMMSPPR